MDFADVCCVVPGCNFEALLDDAEQQLIEFPRSEALSGRWEQAISVGSGVLFQLTDAAPQQLAICKWHFGDEPLLEYREPRRFVNPDGLEVEVSCCRFCLQFSEKSATVPNDGVLGKQSIDSFLKQTLKISLLATNFLKDVCFECLAKIDVVKQWTQDVRQTEAEFRSILVDASCEAITTIRNEGTNGLFSSIDVTDQKIEKVAEVVDSPILGFSEEIEADEVNAADILDDIEPSLVVELPPQRNISPSKKQRTRAPKPSTATKAAQKPRRVAASYSLKMDYKALLQRKCYICDTVLEDKSVLFGHLTDVHATKIDYHCKECDKTLKSVLSFNHHLSFHDSVNRPLQCSFCTIRFCTAESRKVHENNEHNAGHVLNKRYPKKLCQCETCGKTFKTVTSLREHDDYYHKNIANHVCVICYKSFPTRSLLVKHHVVHTGERLHKCDTCGASFKKSSCLTNHMRKHQGNYKEWLAQRKKPPSELRKRQRSRVPKQDRESISQEETG